MAAKQEGVTKEGRYIPPAPQDRHPADFRAVNAGMRTGMQLIAHPRANCNPDHIRKGGSAKSKKKGEDTAVEE